ncbi:MAG TPA: NAD-dependent epimerase/dehydratase family protein [Lacunisphaera sp.]|jgi:nucleoside-diphosphate-sugar epimerase
MISLEGKRLVIFGCGYVGSAVAHAAVAAGASVEALTRNSEKAVVLRAQSLTKVVVAELSSSDWHSQLESGADFIVNCVSSAGGPDGYRQSYLAGMASILKWASSGKTPIGAMLYTSSTSVYPQGGGAVVDETALADGATPNGKIIRESEMLLQAVPEAVCRRWFILRLAGVYGPERHHLLNQLRAGATTLGGSGGHHLNLVHRDDIVSAVMGCLTAADGIESQIFNVADTAPAWREDVVRWLTKRLGRAMPVFDGIAGARRGGEPMPDRVISSEKIQRVLGWRPQHPDYRSGFDEILATNG